MSKFYSKVVKYPRIILVFFIALAVAGAILQNFVGVNYDMKDYLPEDSKSTVSLELMGEEFDGGIPNARVMVKEVSVPDALEYKEKHWLRGCNQSDLCIHFHASPDSENLYIDSENSSQTLAAKVYDTGKSSSLYYDTDGLRFCNPYGTGVSGIQPQLLLLRSLQDFRTGDTVGKRCAGC